MSDTEERSYIVDLACIANNIITDEMVRYKYEDAFNKLAALTDKPVAVMMTDYMRARVDQVLVDPLHTQFKTGVELRMNEFRRDYDLLDEGRFQTIAGLFRSLSLWKSQEEQLKGLASNNWDVWENVRTIRGTYALVNRGDFRVLAFDQLTENVKDGDKLTLAIQVLTGHGDDASTESDSGL